MQAESDKFRSKLKPPASIVQLNGSVWANILCEELYLINTTSCLHRHVLEYNQNNIKVCVKIKAWGSHCET